MLIEYVDGKVILDLNEIPKCSHLELKIHPVESRTDLANVYLNIETDSSKLSGGLCLQDSIIGKWEIAHETP